MHKMNLLENISDYLNHIKIDNKYQVKKIKCEICASSENTVVREIVSVGNDNFYAKLPVVSCNRCGFLFQNPRFPESFYNEFYSKNYRVVIYGNTKPSKEAVQDQINRGTNLFNRLKNFIPKNGNILDVGSSTGALMKAFLDNGWTGLGVDPDIDYVEYGKKNLNLPVVVQPAEKMKLKNNFYDLIIIMGSLEHIYDPNKTLELCSLAAKENSYLLLEGRGHPQNHSRIYFNHNHHRYFTLNSIKLMMMKYGWEPILTTDEELSGPTRKGSIFCLGVKKKKMTNSEFLNYVDKHKEYATDLITKFDVLDKKWS